MADQPVVITGGSVSIEFDETAIPKNGNNKHYNANKKILRVEVTDGNGKTLFAQDTPSGKVKITVNIG